MVTLRELLIPYMRSMGATEISESTKKHFRRKLEKDFEELLDNNKLYVLTKNLSKVQLVKEVVNLSQELENRKNQGNTTSWPLHA